MSTNSWLPEWGESSKFVNHPNIPNTLAMIIVGKRNSGKTHILLRMLLDGYVLDELTDQLYVLDYNNIIIATKTDTQPKYQLLHHGFKNGLSRESIKSLFINQDKFNKIPIPQLCEYYAQQHPEKSNIKCLLTSDFSKIPQPESLDKNKKNLIIFDDCIDENQDLAKKYFTRGRHSSCNVIFITQNFTQLDRHSIRGQANFFILFKQLNTDLTRFFKDNVSTDESEIKKFKDKVNTSLRKKYGYIAINSDNEKVILMDDIFNNEIESLTESSDTE
jgi:hypothetical protein